MKNRTKRTKFNIAVVGASGMVGGELLGLLESRRFPAGEFYPFNSGRKPARVVFRKKKYACTAPTFEALNPMGTVHGGWYGTILDSCMACAVAA